MVNPNEILDIVENVNELTVLEINEQTVIQENGARGPKGSSIYKGSGSPLNSFGIKGDFYLDTLVYHLYGPKPTDYIWDLTTYISLQGRDGASFLTGSGVPSSTLGKYQDTYLDINSGNLYNNTLSGWTKVANIVNPVEVSVKFEQQSSSSTWTINHNLGYFPNVNISDYGGNNVECDIEQISTNQLMLVFAQPVSGYAYLS